MWLYFLAGGLPISLLLIYKSMENGFLTFGIEGLQQSRDHSLKEWKKERAIVPISNFEIETDVKWCPKTDEIFYRTPEKTNMFQKEWIEVNQYSDLYKKLLNNFKRKYTRTPQTQKNRTKWTKAAE